MIKSPLGAVLFSSSASSVWTNGNGPPHGSFLIRDVVFDLTWLLLLIKPELDSKQDMEAFFCWCC